MATFFDPRLPDEVEVFTFDFTDRLTAGQTIVSATVTALPNGATDLTIGTPSIVGLLVSVLISAGTGGVVDHLECLATLNDSTVVGYCTRLKTQEC